LQLLEVPHQRYGLFQRAVRDYHRLRLLAQQRLHYAIGRAARPHQKHALAAHCDAQIAREIAHEPDAIRVMAHDACALE
jgi:hypothetical protein